MMLLPLSLRKHCIAQWKQRKGTQLKHGCCTEHVIPAVQVGQDEAGLDANEIVGSKANEDGKCEDWQWDVQEWGDNVEQPTW